MRRFIDRLKNNRGMSIVEAVVAIGILSVAVVPILSIFIFTAKYSAIAKVKQRATNTGMSVMENLKAYGALKSYEEFKDNTFLSDAVEGSYTYPSSGVAGNYKLEDVKLSDGSDARFNVNISIVEDQKIVNTPEETFNETPFYNVKNSVMFTEEPSYEYDPYYYISKCIDENTSIDSKIKENITKITVERQIKLDINSLGEVNVTYDFSGSKYTSGGNNYNMYLPGTSNFPSVTLAAPLKSDNDLKSIFFYYYPAYDYGRTGYDINDSLIIDNRLADGIEIYLFTQIDGSMDRLKLKNSESAYKIKLKQPSGSKSVKMIDVINKNIGDPSGATSRLPSYFNKDNFGASSIFEAGLSKEINNYPLTYTVTIDVIDTKPLFNSESNLVRLTGTVMR